MAQPSARFAAGSALALFSGVWRVIVNKNDIYMGASKGAMSSFKVSLHKSGVWALAATKESGATFEKGNRRAKRWLRPAEHAPGVTRGPSIFVPHTSLGARPVPPDETLKGVTWLRGPGLGETAEFSFYIVERGAATSWNAEETVLAELPLADGGRVVLLGSIDESPADFRATCERLLAENVFRFDDPTGFAGGSFLWVTESRESLQIPIIVDLPVAVGRADEQSKH